MRDDHRDAEADGADDEREAHDGADLADQVRLVEGSTVQLEIDDGTLKIIPARKKFKLSELLAGEPERTSEQECAEVDWGKPEGDEVW